MINVILNIFLNKNLTNFNMKYKKLQIFYVRSMFKSNHANDINIVKSLFKKEFKIPIDLSNKEIEKENF